MRFDLPTPDLNWLVDWLFGVTGGEVQSGPFKGMKLLHDVSWTDGAQCPMLLGCHEQELHVPLEQEIARLAEMDEPRIANVGCAAGYYAVGLKRRLPHAKVWALDTDSEALRITQDAAAANDVKLIIGSDVREALEAPDLVVIDCEGAEVRYLDPVAFPGLLKAHIIVEIHQSKEQQTGQILHEHWHRTNGIVAYFEGARDPNVYEMLKEESSLVRWLAVCENRPCQMCWFVMTPRETA